jgi:hypothetical protein
MSRRILISFLALLLPTVATAAEGRVELGGLPHAGMNECLAGGMEATAAGSRVIHEGRRQSVQEVPLDCFAPGVKDLVIIPFELDRATRQRPMADMKGK